MKKIVKPFKFTSLEVQNPPQILKDTLEDIQYPNVQKHLIDAVNCLKGYNKKTILDLLTGGAIKDFKNVEIDPSDISERATKILKILLEVIQTSKAKEMGLLYTSKNKFTFNANIFANHFLKRVTACCDKHGTLYVYNQDGYYQQCNQVELGKIVRDLMNEAVSNSWKSIYEKEAITAILREAPFVDELNTNLNSINLENGMYNLTTHTLEKHHPKYFSTVRIPIIYNDSAKCPKFLRFMNEITCNDTNLKKVHQELIGYWLSAQIKCEKAVYFYGRGANGKSVLANIVKKMIGNENVSTIPLAQFNANFGLEGILNKTLNISPENEMNGLKLNTEAFKAIVSGDGITINIKFKSPIVNYQSKCRLLFLGNELPDTSDLTQGYFRRLLIIPFKRTFNENERNRDLLSELESELDGIFNWAMEGLIRLNEQNFIFTKAEAIEKEMKKYHLLQNPVLNFFDSTVVFNEEIKIKRSEVYKLYLKWLEMNGLPNSIRNNRQFKKEFENVLDSKGLEIDVKRINGYDHLVGITFNF